MLTTRRDLSKQGEHPDPLDPAQPKPDPSGWPQRWQRAFTSNEMRAYQAALVIGGGEGSRAGVLDDLSSYFGFSPGECVQRCVNWEQWSVEEWKSSRRDSREALTAFYQTLKSWAFDLLWYAYLQAEGYRYPVSVAIARTVPAGRRGLRHLDFGAGVGATSQLFRSLGYETDLADISTALLAFARYRLERRSVAANYIDLNLAQPEYGCYDVITAVDTLVHVPDLQETAKRLHRALKPGGLLFANFDVRPATAENAWHLYDDDLPLRWQLQRVGFEPEETLDGMITRYRRVEPTGIAHGLRGVRDVALLRSPLRPVYRSARSSLVDVLRKS
jgi:SAM-dependent methyltransferase